jgi:tetratricopeptide (TPR) repeat protein
VHRIQNMFQRWFGRRIRQGPAEPVAADQEGANAALQSDTSPGAIYKKGDFIDQDHEVCDVLGIGGFGVVYLVYAHGLYERQEPITRARPLLFALKTLRDEYLENRNTRERFRREANVWVDLERHPYLVRAHYIREIAGRLYIAMEYVAPDSEGLNSLRGHLERRPPDLAQSLRWAIQFCYGMEYAYAMGVRCHRDIKPDNILINRDHILKITDFGIAGILGASTDEEGVGLIAQNGRIGLPSLTIEKGGGFGTPTHMSPEQFTDPAACDERSDIYSFGVVLYQMRTGGQCPFSPPLTKDDSKGEITRFWTAMRSLHTDAPVPKLNSRLFPVIERCLQKEPRDRYRSFEELRSELEPMLQGLTAEVIPAPDLEDHDAGEWSNKGVNLKELKRYDEAMRCHEKALEIDPRYVFAWTNKAAVLNALERYEEAIACCSKALEIHPRDAAAWNNKGNALYGLERHEEALAYYSEALEIDPQCVAAWAGKGNALSALGRSKEALACCLKALEIDPRYDAAWIGKGVALDRLERYEDAITCYSEALDIHPRCTTAWNNKGNALNAVGRHEEAIECCSKALEIDPRYATASYNKGKALYALGLYEEAIACYAKALETGPQKAAAWAGKGNAIGSLGRYEEAIACYEKALEIDPQYATAWNNLGIALNAMGRHEEAIKCCSKGLESNPRYASAWHGKGNALDALGRYEDAIACYSKALEIDPRFAAVWEEGRCPG